MRRLCCHKLAVPADFPGLNRRRRCQYRNTIHLPLEVDSKRQLKEHEDPLIRHPTFFVFTNRE